MAPNPDVSRRAPDPVETLQQVAARYRCSVSMGDLAGVCHRHDLAFLVLHGSQVAGPVHARSDIDFAYMPGRGCDPRALGVAGDLMDLFGTDYLDAADLRRVAPLMAFNVARRGVLMYADDPVEWRHYQGWAIKSWDDARTACRWMEADLRRSLHEWGVL